MKDGYDILNWYYSEAYQKNYKPGEPQYVGWYDRESQIKRFDELIKIGIGNGHTVLDYGCGTGDFLDYLKGKGISVKYYGLDINDEYLGIAKQNHKDVTFYGGDVIDIDPNTPKVDWIVASGTFNALVPEDWMLFRISICTKLVKRGVAFNLLKESEDASQLIPYDPNDIMIKMVKSFPEFEVKITQNYLTDDFTVFLNKRIIEF